MDDKELVEIWRKEFELIAAKNYRISKNESGHYRDEDTIFLWSGFLMAKRNQPSVVLPKDCGNGKIESKKAKERLTAAGIKYTIGE